MSAIHPRPEQIDELTRGVETLPLNALPKRQLMVIADVLLQTWGGLFQDQKTTLMQGDEEEINTMFVSRLSYCSDPKWKQLVGNVAQGGNTPSYDGSHLGKKPDICIFLTDQNRPSIFPLIVECKLIDPLNRKTVSLYCTEGLRRFIDGEYAWATQEAFMMAYVRDNSTVQSSLVPFLKKYLQNPTDPYTTISLPSPTKQNVSCSQHGRSFLYPSRYGNCPGMITIWHVWK